MNTLTENAPMSFAIVALGVALVASLFALMRKSEASRWLMTYGGFLIAVTPYTLFVLNPERPFTMLPIIAISVILAMVGGAGKAGRWLAQYPLWVLIGLQAFRVPLEMTFHYLYAAGSMPKQMTWQGSNIDIVTGLLAILIATASAIAGKSRPRIQVILAVTFSVVGLALLGNAMRVASASLPHGLTEFSRSAPLLLPYALPYSYIIPIFVFTALFAHIALLRAVRNLLAIPNCAHAFPHQAAHDYATNQTQTNTN